MKLSFTLSAAAARSAWVIEARTFFDRWSNIQAQENVWTPTKVFSNQNKKIIIYDKITEIQVLLYPSLVSRNVLFYSFQPREAVDLKFVLFLLASSEHDFSILR